MYSSKFCYITCIMLKVHKVCSVLTTKDGDWRSRAKAEIVQYVILKWTSLVAFFNNIELKDDEAKPRLPGTIWRQWDCFICKLLHCKQWYHCSTIWR
ncbi:hypothetical protein P8452_70901 [Trifolium repens]|nr:hypothetical protein P8452_07270 [Trifolium repens]WJX26769.1 hypothetical protein P8452_15648 [Trifolium repens]WJX88860.1 hypothetical protein P8452_70901 [Trifolium repens]